MKRVTFQGDPYLFTGDSFEDDGALTTPEDYTHGRASFAHWFPDRPEYGTDAGNVMRYGQAIGTRDDLADCGDVPDVDIAADFLAGVFGDWGEP